MSCDTKQKYWRIFCDTADMLMCIMWHSRNVNGCHVTHGRNVNRYHVTSQKCSWVSCDTAKVLMGIMWHNKNVHQHYVTHGRYVKGYHVIQDEPHTKFYKSHQSDTRPTDLQHKELFPNIYTMFDCITDRKVRASKGISLWWKRLFNRPPTVRVFHSYVCPSVRQTSKYVFRLI